METRGGAVLRSAVLGARPRGWLGCRRRHERRAWCCAASLAECMRASLAECMRAQGAAFAGRAPAYTVLWSAALGA